MKRLIATAFVMLILAGCGSTPSPTTVSDTGSDSTEDLQATIQAGQGATPVPATEGSGDVIPSERLDACAMLTPEDAQGFFADTAPPVAEPLDTGDVVFTCAYTNGNGFGLNLLIRQAADQAESDFIFEQAKDGIGASAEDVAGVGDAAYFDTNLLQISFKKGLYWVLISGVGPEGTDYKASLTALAQAVAGRLP
jgi:hypothetical protein